MKTKEILKVLKEIKEEAPPMIDNLFNENFAKVIFYADGSGHVELNDKVIFNFAKDFGGFQRFYSNWKIK